MPLPNSTLFHDCTETMDLFISPFPHISSSPLPNPQHTWYIDSSSTKVSPRVYQAGYAVVSDTQVIEAKQLPANTTSQQAELITLTRALILARNKSVNIYTDSSYAYHVIHSGSIIWQERGFITTKGDPNHTHIEALLKATMLPSKVAIIHCWRPQAPTTTIAKGNNFADYTAKEIARAPFVGITLPDFTPEYSPPERQKWSSHPQQQHWYLHEGKYILPDAQVRKVILQVHNNFHVGFHPLFLYISSTFFHPQLAEVLHQVMASCKTCLPCSPQGGIHPHSFPAHQARGHLPVQNWQIDFTHMPPAK